MTGLGVRGPRPWKKPLTLTLSQWERKKEGTSRNQYDNALVQQFLDPVQATGAVWVGCGQGSEHAGAGEAFLLPLPSGALR